MRNYTSNIPASRSMENIEKLLVNLGCITVSRFYEEKEVSGFYFQLVLNGISYSFKLPAKVDLIYKQLKASKTIKTENQRIELRKQAARTAWKTLYELIQIQTDLIMLEQIKPFEAFLPYVFDGEKTIAERIEDKDSNTIKLLTPADNTYEIADYKVIK